MGEGEVCLDVLTDGVMEEDGNSPRALTKRDNQCVVEETKEDVFPNKKQAKAKEASNDDLRSEVSNPNNSPRENVSSLQEISSKPAKLASSNLIDSGEVSSICSGDSSMEETVCHVDRSGSDNDTSRAALTSHVVMEIPKHVCTSGIRKITFKFSKKKEDYGSQLPQSGADPCAPNLELKMSKKVVPDNFLSNVKKLLSTGILDGAGVKYVRTTQEKELRGIIGGGGYLCGCSECNFSKVLSAYEFEQHAGGKTRHPNNRIYLDTGKPICSIVQELKTVPLSMLAEVLKDLAGSSLNEERFQAWKESLKKNNGLVEEDREYKPKLLTLPLSSCPTQGFEEGISQTSYSFVQNNPIKCMEEMVDDQKNIVKQHDSFIPTSVMQQKKTAGKGIKRRDNDLHKLLFLPKGLPDGAELTYYVKGQKILGGYKKGTGIVCNCCQKEISPSQFEAHAGMAARRQPYRHIYTSNGLTLHDIAISLSNGQSLTTSKSDDMCTICGDGGELVLCDGCPCAFHSACLNSEYNHEGGWHCPNCREKVGTGKKVAAEESPIARPIILRLTRVVKAPEYEMGGCVVCRAHDFSSAEFGERTVMLCDQCDREYHVGCLRDSGLCDLKELPKDKWFCCVDCNKIHGALQNTVIKGSDMVPASGLSTISRKLAGKGLVIADAANDVQWRILSGKSRQPEHLRLLSRAAAIFRECFDPIVAKSGRDLIPVMVYGRNISGQEFSGMYCVVLSVKSVVISAGLLRIFGRDVAELPLVATSREYQGKGYFQALFSCIERLLYSMNVQKMVLPAAEEAESIWTNKFGFKKMSEEQVSKYMREVQLTIFKKTSMLEKEVQQPE